MQISNQWLMSMAAIILVGLCSWKNRRAAVGRGVGQEADFVQTSRGLLQLRRIATEEGARQRSGEDHAERRAGNNLTPFMMSNDPTGFSGQLIRLQGIAEDRAAPFSARQDRRSGRCSRLKQINLQKPYFELENILHLPK